MDSTTMKGTVQGYFDRAFDEMTDKELETPLANSGLGVKAKLAPNSGTFVQFRKFGDLALATEATNVSPAADSFFRVRMRASLSPAARAWASCGVRAWAAGAQAPRLKASAEATASPIVDRQDRVFTGMSCSFRVCAVQKMAPSGYPNGANRSA